MNKVKALVIFTVFVDVLGLAIIIPVLSFYIQRFGGNAFTSAALFAIYSLCSFLSAPFLGSLSDKIGRKPVLIISIFSTALGWIVFAMAHSLVLLFIGRIIDGLAAGNISTAQSALVDVAKDEKERTANLGIVGMMFGIGFVIGPLLGGILSHFSPTLPFWVVGGMSLLNAILAVFFFPETNHNRNTAKIKLNPFTPIVRALKNKRLLPSFGTWLLFGLATTGFYAIFAFYLQKTFKFDQVFVGICLGLMGVIMAFNQAVAIKKFWLKKFKEPQLEIIMVAALAIGFLLMSTGILVIFAIGFVMMTFANGILQVVITSQTIGVADPKMKGEVTGMLFAISSVAAIIAPLISGNLFDVKPFISVVISAIYMVIALIIIIINRKKLTQVSSAEEEVVPPVI
jgi:DHA1 family tetracycline resistance protein-like MFS transporter